MYAEDEKNKESEGSIGAWYSYYKGIESHVQLYYKNLLVYRINYNEYTGGAHGIYMTTFLNMDLINLRPLKLDDIFTGDYKEALTDLLWNQLMADKKVTTMKHLKIWATVLPEISPRQKTSTSTKTALPSIIMYTTSLRMPWDR